MLVQFNFFWHNPSLVHVLDGGLKKWKKENKSIDNNSISIKESNYKALEKKN